MTFGQSLIANAARQAHWQAHKANSTEANLPKSLPSCSAWVTVFRLTQLKWNTLLTDRGKGERTTWGFMQVGLDKLSISQLQSWALVRAGQTSSVISS